MICLLVELSTRLLALESIPLLEKSYSASQCIRLLSDVTLSNENKLSKLISMIATSMSLIKPLQNRRLDHIEYITTTAFTNRPMSMKYRGIYELNSRRPSDDPLDGYDYVLQYGSNTNELQPHNSTESGLINLRTQAQN